MSRIMIRCRATRTSVTTSRFFVAVVLLSWMLALVCFFVFCFVFPYFFMDVWWGGFAFRIFSFDVFIIIVFIVLLLLLV